VDLADGVAARLASLCLDDSGRLAHFSLWDVAARGALLVDLARTGRLTQDDDSVLVDGTPTGFEPADRLLAAMQVEPEQTLDWWMDHGGVRMRDLAEANVAAGRWLVRRRLLRRRFTVTSPVDGAADRAGPPDAAAVMVLATACGALRRRPEPVLDDELEPTGPLRWICAAVTAHLDLAHRRNLRSAGAADGGFVPYY
jgi:hypothetical protein